MFSSYFPKWRRPFFKAFFCLLFLCFLSEKIYAQKEEEKKRDRDALFFLAQTYEENQQYAWAIPLYEELRAESWQTEMKKKISLRLVLCYSFAKRTSSAISLAQEVIKNFSLLPPEKAKIQYLLAINFMDKNNQAPYAFRKESIEKSWKILTEISSPNPSYQEAQKLWENRVVEKKSPTWAGILGVVPGLGSLYAKKPKEALYSFFVVAMFGSAFLQAQKTHQNILQYAFGFLTLSFYGGSIYAGVNSTHAYNSEQELKFFNQVRDRYQLFLQP